MNLKQYSLIGIGEFSHGIQESWEFRFKLLKDTMRNESQKIMIFNEQSEWNARNVSRVTKNKI